MMNNAPDPITTLAESLIASMNDDSAPDIIDTFILLQSLLRESDYRDLAIALDLCPWHHCDLDTCADDGLDCPTQLMNP